MLVIRLQMVQPTSFLRLFDIAYKIVTCARIPCWKIFIRRDNEYSAIVVATILSSCACVKFDITEWVLSSNDCNCNWAVRQMIYVTQDRGNPNYISSVVYIVSFPVVCSVFCRGYHPCWSFVRCVSIFELWNVYVQELKTIMCKIQTSEKSFLDSHIHTLTNYTRRSHNSRGFCFKHTVAAIRMLFLIICFIIIKMFNSYLLKSWKNASPSLLIFGLLIANWNKQLHSKLMNRFWL